MPSFYSPTYYEDQKKEHDFYINLGNQCRIAEEEEARTICVTPGQNPSGVCVGDFCRPLDLTHQDAGQLIGRNHQGCAQGFGECTIGNPND